MSADREISKYIFAPDGGDYFIFRLILAQTESKVPKQRRHNFVSIFSNHGYRCQQLMMGIDRIKSAKTKETQFCINIF